jgi:hypothetical protein
VSTALGIGEPQLLDLTQVGTIYINFFDQSTGLKIKLKSYTNIKQLNPANGEVVFKIPSEESNKILGLTDKTYYISTVLETGGGTSEETLLYTGTWYNSKDKASTVASDTIESLQTAYKNLSTASNTTVSIKDKQISSLQAEVDYQNQYISGLQAKISELGGNVTDIQNSLSAAQDTIAEQQTSYEQALAESSNSDSQNIKVLTDAAGASVSAVRESELEKNAGISTKDIQFNV